MNNKIKLESKIDGFGSLYCINHNLIIGKIDENEIISIVIKGEEFAKTFKIYFNLLWNISKK